MIKKIYLIGNPNVGKSVVFSRLTGVQTMSSNYPGTTVEFIKGYLSLGNEKIEVIDLPGTYSLDATSGAEEVAISLLKELPKDEIVVINILDSTNLERNLLLTVQLIEDGLPTIVCLNMCDDAAHRGVHIDFKKLEEILHVPVIPTCAVTGRGIRSLIERIGEARPVPRDMLSHEDRWKEIGRIIEIVQHLEHRHHTLREHLEDASVRPVTGLIMASAVIYASFKIVRFLGEFIISRITDPI
ncbi:MAG: FeoB small GTPase domain-containing protein, partial [Candidatus Omnitrophota bacterium]